MNEAIGSQVSTALVFVWLLEKVKASKWFPSINDQTGRLNRVIAFLVAIASAAGIHAVFDVEAGVLTITGLTMATVSHFGWDVIEQVVLQEAGYSITKIRKQTKNGNGV